MIVSFLLLVSLYNIIWERFKSDQKLTRSMQPDSNDWTVLYDNQVGPLLETTWNQYSPYNNNCPYISGTSQHAYVGCVPIAIAQVMRFFEYPTTYSWTAMPNNSANSSLWTLFSDIWSHIGVGINIFYDSTGTRVNHSFDIGNYLKNEFGYSSATQTNYSKHEDYEIVRDELIENERPVIFKGVSNGKGHAWVCDGVHEWQEECYVNNDHYLVGHMLFHHVWGEFPEINAWYAFSIFQPNNSIYNFGSNMKLVYNICP